MSRIRKIYFIKLVLRIMVLIASVILFFVAPNQFDIIEGWDFCSKISVFHLLWLVWILDMITQLMPVKNIALGSQKFFKEKFRPALNKILDWDQLKDYIIKTNKAAGKVMALWALLIVALGILKGFKIIENKIWKK